MRAIRIFQVIFIFIIFLALILYNVFAMGIKNIQDNWPVYRCKPSVMPFAGFFGHDASENLEFCVQNMQTSYMSVLMQPVNYTLSNVSTTTNELTNNLQSMRNMFSSLRGSTGSGIADLYGVFLNISMVLNRIVMKIKDTVNKMVGTVFVIIYFFLGMKDTLIAASDPESPIAEMISLI